MRVRGDRGFQGRIDGRRAGFRGLSQEGLRVREGDRLKYMGSKARVAKEILPIMLRYRKPGMTWVEPFVGGGNTIDRVGNPRIGADANRYTIEALVAIRDNVADLPRDNREFTEADYLALRNDDSYRFKGYAGFAFSYGGKWLGGWRRDGAGARDYVNEAYRNAVQQSPKLQGVKLVRCSYAELEIPSNSLVYCDPPYQGTTRYMDAFNHDKFWQWCRYIASAGNIVFVSEYATPEGFRCLWQKQLFSSLTKDTGSKAGVERLFLCQSQTTLSMLLGG